VNQRPLANSINGREAAWAASIAAQAAGSNPVTRTKKKRVSKDTLFFLVFAAGSRTSGLLHFNQRPRSGLGGVHRRTGRWLKSSHSGQEKGFISKEIRPFSSLLIGIIRTCVHLYRRAGTLVRKYGCFFSFTKWRGERIKNGGKMDKLKTGKEEKEGLFLPRFL
jgi:hypothetical protein